jgi:uncharacterized membrane-anchored protein YjiN (DUF445 family)
VKARLNQTDFAALIVAWLADRGRNADLARLVLRLLPDAISVAESSGLNAFIARLVQRDLEAIDLAPVAAGALRAVMNEGRHQYLLDDVIAYLGEVLNKPQTLAAMREKIRTELPTLLRLYQADFFLLKKWRPPPRRFSQTFAPTPIIRCAANSTSWFFPLSNDWSVIPHLPRALRR